MKMRYVYDYSGKQRRPVGVVVADAEGHFGVYFDAYGRFDKKFARGVARRRLERISREQNLDRIPRHLTVKTLKGEKVRVKPIAIDYIEGLISSFRKISALQEQN